MIFAILHRVLAFFVVVIFAAPAQALTLTISCGAVGVELEVCREGAEAWGEKTGHQVELVSTPNSSTERLSLYQQILSARSEDIDVMQIDVVWPGMLHQHLYDLSPHTGGAEQAHFASIVANNTVNGRLVAMPWYTSAGVLYYRQDLLQKYAEKPPETWEQLTATASRIQQAERKAGNPQMWGFVWQGRAYEGLTCDALEWIYSYGGGTIIDQQGKVTINNEPAKKALAMAKSWIGNITPKGVLNYAEEESRGVFQSGNAVFMRNWPYAWNLSQAERSPIKGKVGVIALPKGGDNGQHASALGGWQLAVSKYSEHPEVAADLVMFLTSFEQQKIRAIRASYNPTIEALYQDKEVLAQVPFFGMLYGTFASTVARPSTITGDQYGRASNLFFNAVHSVISGRSSSDVELARLEKQLKRMVRRR